MTVYGFFIVEPHLPKDQKQTPQSTTLQNLKVSIQNEVSVPNVSIVVPVYNVGQYLSQCLDSLVHQTLKNIEIVVVDDASTDNSAEIINNYRAMYPNIHIIYNEHNQGTGTTRNIGMHMARGQYIAFIDGDDWADTKMCEVMLQRALEDDVDVLIADAIAFDEDSKCFVQLYDHKIRKLIDIRSRTIPFEITIEPRVLQLEKVVWTKLYKRSFLEKYALQFEEGKNSYEDIIFHFSVLLKAKRITLIDDVLIFHREHRHGQITERTNRKLFEVFDVFSKIRENLTTWDVSDDIWGQLITIQVQIFSWLLNKIHAEHKEEFLALVAIQFDSIPKGGFRYFSQYATPEELSRLFCMRRNWLQAYKMVAEKRWPLFQLLCAVHDLRPGFPKRNFKRILTLYCSFFNERRRII